MHLAILITNTDDSAFARARPDDRRKFRDLIAPLRPNWQLTAFAVKDGVFPDDLGGFDGAIIGGSPASVLDDHAWIAPLMALIRDAHARKLPLYGACFGHQAIALALGGKVAKRAGGLIMALVHTSACDGTPPLTLYAAHEDEVTNLPPGGELLFTSDICALAAFKLARHIETTQYHPEISRDFMSDLIDNYADKLPADQIASARASLQTPADHVRAAERIVAFFEAAQK